MKQKTISWVAFFFLFHSYTEAMSIPASDTTGREGNTIEAAFLEEYGKDEVSKAIIREYFAKRRGYKWAIIGTAVIAAGSGIGLGANGSANNPASGFFQDNLFWGIGLILSGIAFLLSLGFFLLKSPNRLKKVLDRYQQTGKLSKRYSSVIADSK